MGALTLAVASASQCCVEGPNGKTYNGKPCASTTRYYDGFKGACGCGTGNGNGSPFSWQYNGGHMSPSIYTAAASQSLFGSGTWCGSGCGHCYKITTTGCAQQYQGTGATAGESITIMITNLCPANANQQWCPQKPRYAKPIWIHRPFRFDEPRTI